MSSWSVTIVILPGTSVPLALPTVLLRGCGLSPLIGCSWPECVSLQEGKQKEVQQQHTGKNAGLDFINMYSKSSCCDVRQYKKKFCTISGFPKILFTL